MSSFRTLVDGARARWRSALPGSLRTLSLTSGVGVTAWSIGATIGHLSAEAQALGWGAAVAALSAELGKEFVVGLVERVRDEGLSAEDVARIVQEELDKSQALPDLRRVIDEIGTVSATAEEALRLGRVELMDSLRADLAAYPGMISTQTVEAVQAMLAPRFAELSQGVAGLNMKADRILTTLEKPPQDRRLASVEGVEPPLLVFVSSRIDELRAERQAVREAIASLGLTRPWVFESTPATAQPLEASYLDKVRTCDLFVLLVAENTSTAVERELETAVQYGRPILAFLRSSRPGATRNPSTLSLINRIPTKWESFESSSDLAVKVPRALLDEIIRRVRADLLSLRTGAPDEQNQGRAALTRTVTALPTDLGGPDQALERNVLQAVSELRLQLFTAGLSSLPTDFETRVHNFLIEYLGTPDHQVPFGGRDGDIAALDDWLSDPSATPYLILLSAAGGGKSALLVRWCESLLSRGDVAVVFFPVSVRFRTNLAAVVFSSLAARLALLHGERLPWDPATTAEFWRGLVTQYLERPLPRGRRLLVVLDGLDEAGDWEAAADLFPRQVGKGTRVVTSARYLAEDAGTAAWLRRLGWDRGDLGSAANLGPLTSDGVAQVIRVQYPSALSAASVYEIAEELHRLSEGDPLVLSLHLSAHLARPEALQQLSTSALQNRPPGLSKLLEQWWDDQRRLWGAANPVLERRVRETLSVLCCALGPLTRAELLQLASPEADLDSWTLSESLRPLNRLVVSTGDPEGLVFSHPRLREYFSDRLTEEERRRYQGRFVEWGNGILAGLEQGRLQPGDVPSYLVQYYGAHLEATGAPVDKLRALISGRWLSAWDAQGAMPFGFVNDVHRAWRAAEREDRGAAEIYAIAPNLETEMRAALHQARVYGQSRNVPAALLLALLKNGRLTASHAFAYASQNADPVRRALAQAVVALDAGESRDQLLYEAYRGARALDAPEQRSDVLAALLPYMGDDLKPRVLEEVLDACRTIKEPSVRALALAMAARHAPSEEHGRLVGAVLRAATECQVAPGRAGSYRFAPWLYEEEDSLKRFLAHTERADFEQGLRNVVSAAGALSIVNPEYGRAVANALESSLWRAQALLEVCRRAPALQDGEVDAAIREIRATQESQHRDRAIVLCGPPLAALERFEDVLRLADEVEHAASRTRVLLDVAPLLPPDLARRELEKAMARAGPYLPLPEAFGLAVRLADEGEIETATSLAHWYESSDFGKDVPAAELLAPYLDEEALRRTLSDVRDRFTPVPGGVVCAIAKRFASLGLWSDAMSLVRETGENQSQAETLVALANETPGMPVAALSECIEIAQTIATDRWRSHAFGGLADSLPVELLDRAFEAVRRTPDDDDLMLSRTKMAALLPAPWPDEALQDAYSIRDVRKRVDALLSLVGVLSQAKRLELWESVVRDGSNWGDWPLRVLLHRLAEVLESFEADRALTAVLGLASDHVREKAFEVLAPHLDESLVRRAIDDSVRRFRKWGSRAAILPLLRRLAELGRQEEALTIGRAHFRYFTVVGELAQFVGEKHVLRALSGAQQFSARASSSYFSGCLEKIAPYLPARVIPRVRQAAESLEPPTGPLNDQTKALTAVALRASTLGLADQARAAVRAIAGDLRKGIAIARIAPELPDADIPEWIDEARAINWVWGRAYGLAGLVHRVPLAEREKVVGEVLNLLHEIEDDAIRATSIEAIAASLTALQLKAALSIALSFRDECSLVAAVSALAPYMQMDDVARALERARTIEQEPNWRDNLAWEWKQIAPRTSLMASLSRRLVELPRPALYPLWLATLHELSRRTERDLLQDFAALSPIIGQLGGTSALQDWIRAYERE